MPIEKYQVRWLAGVVGLTSDEPIRFNLAVCERTKTVISIAAANSLSLLLVEDLYVDDEKGFTN